jgi:DNA (cytosine-5)-methyltransferase 1
LSANQNPKVEIHSNGSVQSKIKGKNRGSHSSAQHITFIDLFAGIGGIHQAFHAAGAECVFVSEKDKYARQTYIRNFIRIAPELFKISPDEEFGNKTEALYGRVAKAIEGKHTPRFNTDITDLTKLVKPDIPNFNILTAGFPCQPFSNVGLRKGMEEARGTLFYDILNILKMKKEEGNQPQAFFLENVLGILNHKSQDKLTIKVIESNLKNLGYSFNTYVVKASDFGLPQHRPRVFMIGFLNPDHADRFKPPLQKKLKPGALEKILGGTTDREIGYTLRVGGRGSGIGDRRNWDTYIVDGQPFKIGPEEGLRLQGFPASFRFPDGLSEAQKMKQLGNSVAIPAVKAYAQEMIRLLRGEK